MPETMREKNATSDQSEIAAVEPAKIDDPRPASPRLILQLQAAVRRAQERKDNKIVSPLAAFAAELDAKARGREPVEFMGALGKRHQRAVVGDESEE